MTVSTPKFPHILHGGDYNPEQWRDYPDILDKDIELFKKANINCVSLGIFSWAALEPEKDKFCFEWLDEVIEKLYANGIYVNLATPSGARPQWLAQEYPEVLRVGQNGIRNFFGHRHNHCYTSPAYRERVRIINTKLAERYASNPAIILWHISNEFGGECHCELCQEKFREWLKEKYGSLDNLNHAWWSHFWSHTYTDWSQLHSPSYMGETSIHGLDIDWRRFVTDRTIDFMKAEISAVKSVDPDIPVTANLMGIYAYELNYFKLGRELDVVSWDSYPDWHNPNVSDFITARNESLSHDMMRSIKKQPFLLMECTPSTTNWRSVSKLKKPNMHELSVINAIAHGSDSGMYFQLRQSRGSAEKFHSAVISHTGTDNTRVFREVSKTGADLQNLSKTVYGSSFPAEAAIIFDTENKWALDKIQGPRNAGLDYFGLIQNCYDYFFRNGINVDILDCDSEFSGYKLIIAPMLYMFRGGIQEKLRSFVSEGGTLISTAFTGVVNDTDLCFLGEATKEKLSDVFGMWVEEIDGLHDGQKNSLNFNGKEFDLHDICEIIHTAKGHQLAKYQCDYYKGTPAMTENHFGKGWAFHICSIPDTALLNEIIGERDVELQLERSISTPLPDGVTANYRVNGERIIVFLQNFNSFPITMELDGVYTDILSEKAMCGITLDGYGFAVIEKKI